MIETPTILILGAGASKPYGFPTGRELYYLIVSKLSDHDEDPAFHLLLSALFSSDEIECFTDDLRDSDAPSIDAFLEHQDEYIEIGKFAIAYFMLLYEIKSNLLKYEISGYWYNLLKNKMLENCPLEKFGENVLSIITFNYDRSLDEYLMTTLPASYKLSSNDYYKLCKEQLKQINFIHIYGSLGLLPWQAEEYEESVEYKAYWEIDIIKKCAQNIKTISEATENREIEKARQWLKNAERIYFLGFGYHSENIKILKPEDWGRNKIVMGTCKGLSLSSKYEFWEILRKTFCFHSGYDSLYDEQKEVVENHLIDTDVYDFMHNYARLN